MLLAALTLIALATPAEYDRLWQQFHQAGDAAKRGQVWRELQANNWPADFDRTAQRLRARRFAPDVPTGELHEERLDLKGRRFRYTVLVPESYDPQRIYPLQMVLHGSTRRSAWKGDEVYWRWLDPFRSEDTITVFPAAWDRAMWWSDRQVENFAAILDRLRARYNIDPNRCSLTGVSDGGTGTYYHALRAPTPWATFLPLIGHPWVLGNREEGAYGDIFAANLWGRSLLAVNGRDDPLYPAAALTSYLDLFRRAGAFVEFKIKPGGHNVRWWPEEADAFRDFRESHPRDPFPDVLVWETDKPRTNGRANWVVINELGNEAQPNPDPLNTVLFPKLDPPTRSEAFPRHGLSGRVILRHVQNSVFVETRNLRRLTILLGADEFDFESEIRIVMNRKEIRRDIRRSVETLMKWGVHDGDPTMLIGAELELQIDP